MLSTVCLPFIMFSPVSTVSTFLRVLHWTFWGFICVKSKEEESSRDSGPSLHLREQANAIATDGTWTNNNSVGTFFANCDFVMILTASQVSVGRSFFFILICLINLLINKKWQQVFDNYLMSYDVKMPTID